MARRENTVTAAVMGLTRRRGGDEQGAADNADAPDAPNVVRAFGEASKPSGYVAGAMLGRHGQALAERLEELTARNAELTAELQRRQESGAANDRSGAGEGDDLAALRSRLEASQTEIARLLALQAAAAGDPAQQLRLLDPARVSDPLPSDRFGQAFADDEFRKLRDSIAGEGQDTAILVRAGAAGADGDPTWEIAAGRRRLAACRELGIPVLARVAALDDAGMLRAQLRENAQRAGVGAFERARWFAEIQRRSGATAAALASEWKIDRTTMAHYLRVAALSEPIVGKLQDPRKLTMPHGRRLLELLAADAEAEARVLAVLDAHAAKLAAGDRAALAANDVLLAIAAAEGKPQRAPARRDTWKVERAGRRYATVSFVNGRCNFAFAPGLDAYALERLAQQLPDLIEDLQRQRYDDGEPVDDRGAAGARVGCQ